MAEFFLQAVENGATLEADWNAALAAYSAEYPELGAEMKRILAGKLPANWQDALPEFETDEKGMATRAASGKVLNALAPILPDLLGGSADLAPSNKTWIDGEDYFHAGAYGSRNFHFGVREHGMGAIVNGMSLYPGILPYGGTFLVFSDYMRGALRVGALSHYHTIWVFTHDSIGLGEDGPTHQPVEHAAALRAMPNMTVIRPADANEVAEAWRAAILNHHGPTSLLLSRQGIPTLDRAKFAPAEGLQKGAYVLADLGGGDPEVILMSTGTEVQLIVEAGEKLAAEGKRVRLVSFPSWELFASQDKSYRDSVLPPQITARVSIEAGVSMGWERWVGDHGRIIAVNRYGASAPYKVVYEKFGLTAEAVCLRRYGSAELNYVSTHWQGHLW